MLAIVAIAVVSLIVVYLADRAVRATVDARRLSGPTFPISICKPVKGLDEGFAENLASLARQAYPDFEILVGAAERNDPALAVARQVAANHPNVSIRTIVCPDDGGKNPKVSILKTLSRHTRYDHMLISDSNVRVSPGYLTNLAAQFRDPSVGLATNPIAGLGEESTGARLEGLHLVTYVARALAFARHYAGHACVVGKSMLFRQSDWRRIGGWSTVRDILAEDYAIGHAFEEAGYRVAVSPDVIFNFNQRWPVARFINRHMRWGQMRRRTSLPAFLAEPLSNPIAWLSLLAMGALGGGRDESVYLPLALAGISLKLAWDRTLITRLCGAPPTLSTLLLGVPKDLLMLGIWGVAAFRRTIDWRGNRFLIQAGTRLVAAPTSTCAETAMVLPPR